MITSLRLYAGTNVGLRDNNEDSYTVCLNLSLGKWNVPDDPGHDIPFDGAGCLMVVADGMGGQNAGEVASDIAVKTVQEMFVPANLPDDIEWSPDKAKDLLRKVIVEANARICAYGDSHEESEGLGSTIVMAWLLGQSVYVAWLGDSRAYSFVPGKGIARLSKDHSYVQQLVDADRLSEEEAMNHPDSNVITRSLGDTSQRAKPDVEEYSVEDGEIIMLCSDGLCGVCRDEEIGYIISENTDDLRACVDKLTTKALANGGSDNITIAMMRVCDMPATGERLTPSFQTCKRKYLLSQAGRVFTALFALLLVGAIGFGAYNMISNMVAQQKEEENATDKPSQPTKTSEDSASAGMRIKDTAGKGGGGTTHTSDSLTVIRARMVGGTNVVGAKNSSDNASDSINNITGSPGDAPPITTQNDTTKK